MTTGILPQRMQLQMPSLRLKRRQPFLKALEHIDYGRLSLITPDGERLEFSGSEKGPSAHLRLFDWGVFEDLTARGEIGFADAYIDGRWESTDIPALLTFALLNGQILEEYLHGKPWYIMWLILRNKFRSNSLVGSRRNIMAHYDLGNDFYAQWLDKGMTYSGALFEGDNSRTLEEAQAAKYHRILQKLSPMPGDRILEIGCGWGGFAEIAARYGLRVTAVTLSEPQANYAAMRIKNAGIDDLAKIEVRDYREITGTFDHVVSIGMFEHVGENFWPVYFDVIKQRLKPGGTAIIQSIMLDDYLFEALRGYIGFVEYYIFPGGMLPSKTRFRTAASLVGLECCDMFGFGQDYARTIRHWLSRFEAHQAEIKALGYDEPFIRLWRFYLSCCIASFTSHRTDVVQAELKHKR